VLSQSFKRVITSLKAVSTKVCDPLILFPVQASIVTVLALFVPLQIVISKPVGNRSGSALIVLLLAVVTRYPEFGGSSPVNV
jgi:hypothetical protein